MSGDIAKLFEIWAKHEPNRCSHANGSFPDDPLYWVAPNADSRRFLISPAHLITESDLPGVRESAESCQRVVLEAARKAVVERNLLTAEEYQPVVRRWSVYLSNGRGFWGNRWAGINCELDSIAWLTAYTQYLELQAGEVAA